MAASWLVPVGFASLTLIVSGCTTPTEEANNGATNDGNNGNNGNNGTNNGGPPEWFACEAAGDCTIFEGECCDHCNGGRLVSVNRDYLVEARARLQETDCEGVACTEIACVDEPRPTCEGGVCGWAIPTGCEALTDEALCEASPDCRPIRGALASEVCAGNFDHWASLYGGCMDADLGCGDAETCALRPGDGERIVFPSTCIPAGWTSCGGDYCNISGECAEGEPAMPGVLCVRGEPDADGERLSAGTVRFDVRPRGCFSSSCTIQYEVTCMTSVDASNASIGVEARFCLGATGDEACTADCSGGGFASCYADLGAAAETVIWTAVLDDIVLSFPVPGTVPHGGSCEGSEF